MLITVEATDDASEEEGLVKDGDSWTPHPEILNLYIWSEVHTFAGSLIGHLL